MFRYAVADDVPALKALVERGYRGDSARGGWTHEADLLDDERIAVDDLAASLADPEQRIIVTQHGAAFAGCVAITDLGGGRAYLGMLCVDPASQAGGLGRALIAEAEAAAASQFGTTVMELTVVSVREELIAWYLRRGYALTGETRPFPAPSGPHLHMVVLARTIA